MEKRTFTSYANEIKKSVNFLASYVSHRSPVEFEDAQQEMMIAAWQAYCTYQPEISKFSTYAVLRMKNRAKTLLHLKTPRRHTIYVCKKGDTVRSVAKQHHISVDRLLETSILTRSSILRCGMKVHIPFTISIISAVHAELIPDTTPSAEDAMIVDCEREEDAAILDDIEQELYLKSQSCGVTDQRAYSLFVALRREQKEVKIVGGTTLIPKKLSDVARETGQLSSRLSTIFDQKIRKVWGPKEQGDGISIVSRENKPDRRREMATKTTAKKKSAPVKAGRTPQKGGLKDKIAWVDLMFCQKDKTRPQAVEGLQKKYPEMSENYARTIVYSQMKDYDFVPARTKTKKVVKKTSSTSSTAKKSSSVKKSAPGKKSPAAKSKAKPKKAAPVEDDEDEGDFEF